MYTDTTPFYTRSEYSWALISVGAGVLEPVPCTYFRHQEMTVFCLCSLTEFLSGQLSISDPEAVLLQVRKVISLSANHAPSTVGIYSANMNPAPHCASLIGTEDIKVYVPTNIARWFPFLHTLSNIYCL